MVDIDREDDERARVALNARGTVPEPWRSDGQPPVQPPTAVGAPAGDPEPAPMPRATTSVSYTISGTPFIPMARGEREALPQRRASNTMKVRIGGSSSLYIQVGRYPDGRPGEIFLTQSKTGTFNRGVIEGFAIMFSMALQYGTPLQDIVDTYRHVTFEPSGYTDDPEIPECTSVFDYIAQRLALDYIK